MFGASNDLQIYHDGTDSFISDQGTGNLKLLANDFRLANAANNELMIKADQSGAVDLRYAGSPKLATTSTGISISNDANFPDNGKAIFGAGDDLEIFSNGSTALLKAGNATSDIRIESDNRIVIADRGFVKAFFTRLIIQRLLGSLRLKLIRYSSAYLIR